MTTMTDDELVTQLRAALDELTATSSAAGDPPSLGDWSYSADVVPLRHRRWPIVAAAVAVAAAAAVAAVAADTREVDRVPTMPSPSAAVPAASAPSTTLPPTSPPPTESDVATLPQISLDLPGAQEDPSSVQVGPVDALPPTRIYATDGDAPAMVLVVQTRDAELQPIAEGDYTMDPIPAPSGEAWIIHSTVDEPGNHTPLLDRGEVWWSPGHARDLVVVSGQGYDDVALEGVLPELQLDGDVWSWIGSEPAALVEVPRPAVPPSAHRTSQTVLADGERVTIDVQTGDRWALLQQTTVFRPVTQGLPPTAPLPDGTTAVLRSDPGSLHAFWLQGGALVHLSVASAEDLPTILAAVRTTP
jgi:hypothetical protein